MQVKFNKRAQPIIQCFQKGKAAEKIGQQPYPWLKCVWFYLPQVNPWIISFIMEMTPSINTFQKEDERAFYYNRD